MSNPLLIKSLTAGAAIAAYTIVKYSAAETVVQAASATDAMIGVCGEVSPAAGERVDIIKVGMAFVLAGAAVTQGGPVTSDAQGRAVNALPAAGSNVRVIGFADEAASAAGDIIRITLSQCVMQG